MSCLWKILYSQRLFKTTLTYSNQRNFKYDLCDKTFTQKSNVKSHMLVHTVKKDFQCEVGEKMLSLKGNLQSYMLSHTKVKAHECDICF